MRLKEISSSPSDRDEKVLGQGDKVAGTNGIEVGGFLFATEKEADIAREEIKKIYYIRTRLHREDPESMLVIYNKLIETHVFSTPIGINFLSEIHSELISSGTIREENILSIPVAATRINPDESILDDELPTRKIKRKKDKNYFAEYNICRLIIVLLLICVGAMFYITLHSDNPNILNYETAIQNKYASWSEELNQKEKELRDREKAIEEKESSLGINGDMNL